MIGWGVGAGPSPGRVRASTSTLYPSTIPYAAVWLRKERIKLKGGGLAGFASAGPLAAGQPAARWLPSQAGSCSGTGRAQAEDASPARSERAKPGAALLPWHFQKHLEPSSLGRLGHAQSRSHPGVSATAPSKADRGAMPALGPSAAVWSIPLCRVLWFISQ